MKTLVIYYSFEGNTRFIAEAIAKDVNADVLELKLEKEIKSRGFMKYIWGGRQVIMQIKPEILPFNVNPLDYDVIFIGTPVWAGTFTPSLRTFFDRVNLEGKKIALFCCYASNSGKTFEKLREILKDNTIIGEIGFEEPLKNKEEQASSKITSWANEMVKTLA